MYKINFENWRKYNKKQWISDMRSAIVDIETNDGENLVDILEDYFEDIENPYNEYDIKNLPKDFTEWEKLIKHSSKCKRIMGCQCNHHEIIHRIRAEICRALNT